MNLKKLARLVVLALAFSASALLPTPAKASPPGFYYVCVDTCIDCFRSWATCQNGFCEELVFGCEETSGIACRCSSY